MGRRLARNLRPEGACATYAICARSDRVLHIGHVVNAIFVWGLARALGGQVLLRIEDHDRQRCRPEFEDALLEDLDWLGFTPDVFPTAAFRAGATPGRQSDRDAAYREALAPLMTQGSFTAATVRAVRSTRGLQRPCRDRDLPLADDVGWRVRVEPHRELFDDVRLSGLSSNRRRGSAAIF